MVLTHTTVWDEGRFILMDNNKKTDSAKKSDRTEFADEMTADKNKSNNNNNNNR